MADGIAPLEKKKSAEVPFENPALFCFGWTQISAESLLRINGSAPFTRGHLVCNELRYITLAEGAVVVPHQPQPAAPGKIGLDIDMPLKNPFYLDPRQEIGEQ